MNLLTNLLIIFILIVLLIVFLKIRRSNKQQTNNKSKHSEQNLPKKSCIKQNGLNKKHNKRVRIVEPLPKDKKQQIQNTNY